MGVDSFDVAASEPLLQFRDKRFGRVGNNWKHCGDERDGELHDA
jgi:hypothetical protein